MNVLIVGCGKVGANLCGRLSDMGCEISVVSDSEEDFSELPTDFDGYTNTGVVTDQDVLKRAGIENCDAVVAVTPDDNINLMIIQLAGKLFNIKNAYARVNDPKKEDVFSCMGLNTICPTNLTVDAMASAVCGTDSSTYVPVGNHNMVITRVTAEKIMFGMRVSELQMEDNETIIAIEHSDSSVETIFLSNYEITEGDTLICARFVD